MSLEPISASQNQPRTSITVRPEPEAKPESSRADDGPRWRKSIQKATLGDNNKEFGVDDFIDLVNPLHHFPVVGQIYRAVTGDEISPEAQVLGGSLFGGPVGMLASAATALIAQERSTSTTQTAAAEPAGPKTMELAQAARRPMLTPPTAALAPPSMTTRPDTPAIVEPEIARSRPEAVEALPGATPKNAKELEKYDAILDLFGNGVSDLSAEQQQWRYQAHVAGARAKLTV